MNDSEEYQQLVSSVNEEESWIGEKRVLVLSEDYGDTLASVQGLLKKHEAFETDFAVHQQQAEEIKKQAQFFVTKVICF